MNTEFENNFQPQQLLNSIDRLSRYKKEDSKLRAEIARLEDQVTLQNALLEQNKFDLTLARSELEKARSSQLEAINVAAQERDRVIAEIEKRLNEEVQKRTQAEDQHQKLLQFVSGQLRENVEITQAQEELQGLRTKYQTLLAELTDAEFDLKEERAKRMNFEAEAARLRYLLSESKT